MHGMTDMSSLIVGGIGSTVATSYLGLNTNPVLSLACVTAGGVIFSYAKQEFNSQKNMFGFVNGVEQIITTCKSKLGLTYYTLIINEDCMMYTKLLSYIIRKYSNRLIANTANYVLKNEINLAELKFDTAIVEQYEMDGKTHTILLTFNNASENKYGNVVVKSKTLDVDNLHKYIRFVSFANTNNISITVFQPTFTRMGNEDSKSEASAHKIKTIVRWHSFYVRTNKNIYNTIVSEKVRSDFLCDVKAFLENEQYYNSKGIPYKRGYLLYGPPGTGKTSLIKAVANTYGMDVYMINMGEVKTSDDITKLFYGFRNADNYHVVCFEDIDRCDMFKNLNNKYGYGYVNPYNDSLRTLLNELDGVVEGNKRLTIFTANDTSIIDTIEALCRPGRIDKKIEIGNCTFDQLNGLYNHYTLSGQTLDLSSLDIVVTPASVIKILLAHPFDLPNAFMERIKVGAVNQTTSTVDPATTNKRKTTKDKIYKRKIRKSSRGLKKVNLQTAYKKHAELTKVIEIEHKKFKLDCDKFIKKK